MKNQFSFTEIVGEDGIFVDGDWIESKDQDPNGSVRLIQLADIGEGTFINKSKRFLTHEKALELKCTFLEPGDVLIARMPDPLGRACIFPKLDVPCVTVVDVCIVRPDKNQVMPEWLMFKINSPEFREKIQKYITGTTRQRISRGNLEKIKFNVPQLDEQKRIVKILSKANSLQQKRKHAINLLDEYISLVFLDLFGDPSTNPRSWETKEIADLVSEVKYGTSGKAGADGKFPYLRMNNITYSGELDLSNMKYIDLGKNEEDKYLARKGDLLFNRTNSRELVGKTAVFDLNEPMAIAGYLIRVRTNSKALPEYISGYLNSKHGKQTLEHMCKSIIGMANINAQELQKIKILLPPLDLQVRYRNTLLAKQALKKKMVTQAKALDMQFQSLLQSSFSSIN